MKPITRILNDLNDIELKIEGGVNLALIHLGEFTIYAEYSYKVKNNYKPSFVEFTEIEQEPETFVNVKVGEIRVFADDEAQEEIPNTIIKYIENPNNAEEARKEIAGLLKRKLENEML